MCSSEPAIASAGNVGTWKFSYATASLLPKGTKLKFDLLSKGRPIDWALPSTNMKEKKNIIWAEIEGKTFGAKEIASHPEYGPAFEFILPQELKIGESIHICLGLGNRCQSFVQRRRPVHLYIDPKGKGDYKEPEVFTVDVKGGELHNIRITAPSVVAKNKRFDVSVRFEDVFGNLTSHAPEGTLIDVSYENLRENLNWKLFVPETGFLNIPNLYFNEPGFYRVQLRNLKTGLSYFSSPVKCFAETEKNLFWGSLHGESEKFDALENIESCLRYFRDDRNMQFYSTSPFENCERASNEVWKAMSSQVSEFNEDFRFAAFLGFQWFSETEGEGLRQVLYAKDNRALVRKKEAKTSSMNKIYKSHTPKDLISIPSFTMGKGFETTFDTFDPDFEKVVEIYNAWGCSECTAKEGNLRPITTSGKKGVQESEKGSIRRALNQNIRLGFVAGGLDDRGIYTTLLESDQVQYSPGLTGIYATEHTKEALFVALQHRSCYATTGARIVAGFSIAGSSMGSELSTKNKPGLQFNRHLTGFVAGTAPIKEILFIRNGKPFHTICPKTIHHEFALDDTDLLSEIAFTAPQEGKPPFVYYYLRILQEDGHIAWISPIWIDLVDAAPSQGIVKKTKKVKSHA
jgi:hypothetical protein